MKISFFSGSPLSEIISRKLQDLTQTIANFEPDYLLKVSESDLGKTLSDKYSFCPILLKVDQKRVEQYGDVDLPRSNYPDIFLQRYDLPHYVKGTQILISIPFEGDSDLFQYRGSTYSLDPPEGQIIGDKIVISIEIISNSSNEERQIEEVKKQLDFKIREIEKGISWINKDVSDFNKDLPKFIQSQIQKRKEKILRDEHIVASLNLPLRRTEIGKTIEIPEIKQKIVITFPNVGEEKFEPEPTLGDENYTSILKIIQNMIRAIERSPSTFSRLSEEELRDFILVYLNGIFEGSATGETFNENGKTDILIRIHGKTLFIAECKFWKGSKSISAAIDQLLSYTSWRDTKTALIIFNKTKNFSDILQKIEETIPKHKNYKKLIRKENETTLKYLFHHIDDKNKELYLSVMVFEIPNN